MPATAASSSPSTGGHERIVAEARSIVNAYQALEWFSGSVLLAQAGQPVFQAAAGLANRETNLPNTLETRYNLGSIVKHFTAVLVLQQVERGLISLEDSLAAFELGFPAETARKITVRHLLEHRSGFPGGFPSAYRENPLLFETITEKLALLTDAPLAFEPGTDQRYSNYGYVVLGAILERATGKSFSKLLRENVFARLNLENSVYPYAPDATQQSLRYTFRYDGAQIFAGVTEHHGPDGGIESTVADVLKFYRALFYGDALLSREISREYFPMNAEHWTAFGGGIGISAAVELDLKNDYQIIVLANTDGLVAEEISGRIHAFIQTGSYAPLKLPPNVFAWRAYQELGAAAFRLEFMRRYDSAGYSRFIGRTLNELGMSLLADAKWDDAFSILDALVACFPEAPQVYDSLAYAHLRAGDAETARATFSQALDLQPSFVSDYSPDNYGRR